MKTKTKSKGLSAFALAALLAVPAMAPVHAATLKMAWSQDATGLDPQKQTAFSSIRLLELIYEPLVRLDAKLEVVPAIATSWKFGDDGKSLTFHLDPKATFSNGDKVTAADVKASFERLLDEKTAAAARSNYLSIASIETPDDETVVFKLSEPDVPILAAMASVNAAVLPASAIKDGSVGTKAIGSGPFMLKSWDPNSSEVLTANPHWAGGKPGVDEIDISVIPDETAIVAALRTGKIDLALLNDPLVATMVSKVSGLNLVRTPSISYNVLQLNPSRKPMTELKVRQAISCAIDRQAVLDTAALGEGKVTGPITAPAYATDPPKLFCYTPDLAKAKALMKEAGYADGFTATVIAATGEPATAEAEAQVIQSELKKIGIKLNIKMMQLNVYVDAWLKADFDMAVALNGGRPDPYTMYNRYFTKTGNLLKVSNYTDDTLDTLLNEGRVETDPAKRKAIFAKFDAHLAEMAPWVWLFTPDTYVAERSDVKGFVGSPMGSLYGLSAVTLSK